MCAYIDTRKLQNMKAEPHAKRFSNLPVTAVGQTLQSEVEKRIYALQLAFTIAYMNQNSVQIPIAVANNVASGSGKTLRCHVTTSTTLNWATPTTSTSSLPSLSEDHSLDDNNNNNNLEYTSDKHQKASPPPSSLPPSPNSSRPPSPTIPNELNISRKPASTSLSVSFAAGLGKRREGCWGHRKIGSRSRVKKLAENCKQTPENMCALDWIAKHVASGEAAGTCAEFSIYWKRFGQAGQKRWVDDSQKLLGEKAQIAVSSNEAEVVSNRASAVQIGALCSRGVRRSAADSRREQDSMVSHVGERGVALGGGKSRRGAFSVETKRNRA
ncbi:hypothetical protein BDN72DRAFT_922012 [Pluteus cervinus]|uniref:Uncharacterized protein n=1 Tax=Pluteus cervinus TaxID=181527 RepID=A0ACD3AGX7_9AGAR|nr:hypothetical protein BDN72DRAFT_922012 [Pluteus cervinus]